MTDMHRLGRLLLAVLFGLAASAAARAAEPKPNIVFIMADDLGFADVGYRGSDIKTPNIDKLAEAGVRMDTFYGEPVCTPSRAALMTGRYPMRYGLQTLVIFPSHTYGLPTDERTLPQALKEAGYTTLMTGKWHLGHADRKYWPQNRGFDYFYGNVMGEVDYFTRDRGGVIDWQRNGTFLKEPGYYMTLIGNDAVRLIGQQDGKQPFFLYFASLAPHAPYQAPQSYKDLYPAIKDRNRQAYAGMISALDDQIGRIVAALQNKHLRDNTLILFASDNGGATSGLFAQGAKSNDERQHEEGGIEQGAKAPASNAPLRGGKGSLYEGGVRVVAFANWPGHLKPGIVTAPLHMVDIMPTLLALAGGTGSADHPMDGRDIWPALTAAAPSPNEDILINVEAFRGAVRKGDWKLVKVALLPGKTELFNLADDPGETTNVADRHPEIAADLEARLSAYAKQQKPSEWIKAQPGFAGAQGHTVFDPDFDIGDGGLPHEKPAPIGR
nr:arylsulfatase [uncultured Rhodopila sp.]